MQQSPRAASPWRTLLALVTCLSGVFPKRRLAYTICHYFGNLSRKIIQGLHTKVSTFQRDYSEKRIWPLKKSFMSIIALSLNSLPWFAKCPGFCLPHSSLFFCKCVSFAWYTCNSELMMFLYTHHAISLPRRYLPNLTPSPLLTPSDSSPFFQNGFSIPDTGISQTSTGQSIMRFCIPAD